MKPEFWAIAQTRWGIVDRYIISILTCARVDPLIGKAPKVEALGVEF